MTDEQTAEPQDPSAGDSKADAIAILVAFSAFVAMAVYFISG